MSIMRPAGGFRISLAPAVEQLVAARILIQPSFEQHWKDILERLRFTAHLEGVHNPKFAKGHRLFVAAEDNERGMPRVKLVFHALGANVRIKVAAIG